MKRNNFLSEIFMHIICEVSNNLVSSQKLCRKKSIFLFEKKKKIILVTVDIFQSFYILYFTLSID